MALKRRPVKRGANAGRRRLAEADDYRDDDEDDDEEEKPRRRTVARGRNSSTRTRSNSRPSRGGSKPRRVRDDEDDDEEEEEEKPRRRVASRGSSRSGNSDRKPRRRVSRDDDDEEDDEEDDKPRRRAGKSVVRAGWGGAKEIRAKSGGFATDLDVGNEETLFKFLEDEPFASYRQHWADWRSNGKRSFVCLEDDCALCDIGDRPSAQYLFNVADLSTDEPDNKQLRVGVQALGQIENLSKGKNGPLSKNYWVVSKSKSKGKGNTVAWNFNPVKERDLEEDWEMQPLDDDELAELEENVFDSSIVQLTSKKEMKSLAKEAMDENDYDSEDWED